MVTSTRLFHPGKVHLGGEGRAAGVLWVWLSHCISSLEGEHLLIDVASWCSWRKSQWDRQVMHPWDSDGWCIHRASHSAPKKRLQEKQRLELWLENGSFFYFLSFFFFLNLFPGSVKGSLCKHDDLNLITSTHIKSQSGQQDVPITPELERCREEARWVIRPQVHWERSLLKKTGYKPIPVRVSIAVKRLCD